MSEAAERTLAIDGVRHRWLERGEGRVVVLVHGIPTSPALWCHVMPELAGAQLLAREMIGYGHSHAAGAGRDIAVRAQASTSGGSSTCWASSARCSSDTTSAAGSCRSPPSG